LTIKRNEGRGVALYGRSEVECPYIETDDERCHGRLALENLHEVMEFCADRFCECRMFRERLAEEENAYAEA